MTRHTVTLVFVALVVLAGCGAVTDDDAPNTVNPALDDTPTPTPSPTATPVPTPTATPSAAAVLPPGLTSTPLDAAGLGATHE